MMLERSVSWAMFAILVAGTAAGAQELPEWEPITMERLLNPEDGDWLSYRRTYDVFGFSPLDQINRTNVRDLRLVWAYSMRNNSRWVPTPIVANGRMYVAEGSGRVVAFDVVSGDVTCIHERSYPEDIQLSQAYRRHRGVSVYDDKIYWGTADSYLVALDARTGEQIWEARTGDYHTGIGHNHPPLIAEGKIILGFTGSDRGTRGAIAAYDPQSGELIWKTYTVPAPGEPGSESWKDSVDTPRRLFRSQHPPMVQFVSEEPGGRYAGMRGRPKLVPGYDHVGEFVAFDPITGERAWEYRLPSGAAMTAAALATAGGVVFGGAADRRFFALDTDTGEALWQMRLNGDISGAPVTFEVGGRQYVGVGGRIAQTNSYAPLTGADVPQGSGVIWVFALP